MKCYTIVDSFDGGNELWMTNYASRDSAVKALGKILEHYGMVDGNGNVEDEGWNPTVDELFNYLLQNGCSHKYYYSSGDSGDIFVREEEIQLEFNESNMPF